MGSSPDIKYAELRIDMVHDATYATLEQIRRFQLLKMFGVLELCQLVWIEIQSFKAIDKLAMISRHILIDKVNGGWLG